MMMSARIRLAHAVRIVAAASLIAAAAGCTPKKDPALPAANAQEPDTYLLERGTQLLKARKWSQARQYFKRLVENYPQSPLRPQGKLGVGDSYLVENTAESKVLAVNEFREFLTFFPSDPRADYAQYKLAMSHFAQMLSAQRDQTETREAVKEFQNFFDRFPNSKLRPEVEPLARQARDRLSDSSYEVGYFYFRVKNYAGAIDRFKEVIRDDPAYSGRDALYFYMGESLMATKHLAEALPYYDRLVTEFQKSQYLARAKSRIAELKR
jgi:outer membrane protein assembly factor BamD